MNFENIVLSENNHEKGHVLHAFVYMKYPEETNL